MAGSFEPLDLSMVKSTNPPKVAYMWHPEVHKFNYGKDHVMKPIRMHLTNDIVETYGLTKKMDVVQTDYASQLDIKKHHDEDYVEFLSSVSPETLKMPEFRRHLLPKLKNYEIGQKSDVDNPVFDGMYNFSALTVGASLAGARKLGERECDIAINWAGGLHHAMKNKAHGFCYLNDGVLAILELLDMGCPRVLYVDIDVHHGDGVEEAFKTTDRVMTVSFHNWDGHFFPRTGALRDVGSGPGKNYTVNVPLKDGISSEAYLYIFKKVMSKIMEHYRPSAIVLQCGADSLARDRLGAFNLDMNGHAACVKHMKSLNLPMLVLGGGGYTVANVVKTWAYETGVLVGEEMAREVPRSLRWYTYYNEANMKLNVTAKSMKDENDIKSLDAIITKISNHLKNIPSAPSVAMRPWNLSKRNRENDSEVRERVDEAQDGFDGKAKDKDADGEEYEEKSAKDTGDVDDTQSPQKSPNRGADPVDESLGGSPSNPPTNKGSLIEVKPEDEQFVTQLVIEALDKADLPGSPSPSASPSGHDSGGAVPPPSPSLHSIKSEPDQPEDEKDGGSLHLNMSKLDHSEDEGDGSSSPPLQWKKSRFDHLEDDRDGDFSTTLPLDDSEDDDTGGGEEEEDNDHIDDDDSDWLRPGAASVSDQSRVTRSQSKKSEANDADDEGNGSPDSEDDVATDTTFDDGIDASDSEDADDSFVGPRRVATARREGLRRSQRVTKSKGKRLEANDAEDEGNDGLDSEDEDDSFIGPRRVATTHREGLRRSKRVTTSKSKILEVSTTDDESNDASDSSFERPRLRRSRRASSKSKATQPDTSTDSEVPTRATRSKTRKEATKAKQDISTDTNTDSGSDFDAEKESGAEKDSDAESDDKPLSQKSGRNRDDEGEADEGGSVKSEYVKSKPVESELVESESVKSESVSDIDPQPRKGNMRRTNYEEEEE